MNFGQNIHLSVRTMSHWIGFFCSSVLATRTLLLRIYGICRRCITVWTTGRGSLGHDISESEPFTLNNGLLPPEAVGAVEQFSNYTKLELLTTTIKQRWEPFTIYHNACPRLVHLHICSHTVKAVDTVEYSIRNSARGPPMHTYPTLFNKTTTLRNMWRSWKSTLPDPKT